MAELAHLGAVGALGRHRGLVSIPGLCPLQVRAVEWTVYHSREKGTQKEYRMAWGVRCQVQFWSK